MCDEGGHGSHEGSILSATPTLTPGRGPLTHVSPCLRPGHPGLFIPEGVLPHHCSPGARKQQVCPVPVCARLTFLCQSASAVLSPDMARKELLLCSGLADKSTLEEDPELSMKF
jgi:hypothetical protein